jgi:hypothetical protein
MKYSSPLRGKPSTGEPEAGDPHVRFGGRGDVNQCVVPTPILISPNRKLFMGDYVSREAVTAIGSLQMQATTHDICSINYWVGLLIRPMKRLVPESRSRIITMKGRSKRIWGKG